MEWVVGIVLLLVGFLLLGWVSRRLLGVRYLSLGRTLLSAVVGLGFGALLAWMLERRGVDRTHQAVLTAPCASRGCSSIP